MRAKLRNKESLMSTNSEAWDIQFDFFNTPSFPTLAKAAKKKEYLYI